MILLAFRPRSLTRLFAVAQLALPASLGVADALTAGSGLGTPAHVEDTSSKQCSSVHVDECIVCRLLSTSAVKSTAAPAIMANPALALPASASEIIRRSISRHGLQSRAPPNLLA